MRSLPIADFSLGNAIETRRADLAWTLVDRRCEYLRALLRVLSTSFRPSHRNSSQSKGAVVDRHAAHRKAHRRA